METESCGSQIFAPYRAIGLFCNEVPLALQSRGTDTLVATAVGRSFHVYHCDKLRLIFVGTLQPQHVQALAMMKKTVYASCGHTVKAFRRGKEVHAYHGHEGDVHTIIPFGEHLVTLDDNNTLRIWHSETEEQYGELEFPSSFLITCALHPATYLNKLLLGSSQGQLQLWNFRTSTLLYTFSGWGSKITALAQSQAVDVVGIGMENGNVLLHNLKFDETLMKFQQDWGPVISISFRTDLTHVMSTASPTGHVAVWDLDRRRLSSVIRHAHHSAVTGLRFLPGQPLLITSSPDNSIKMWIFDQSDGSARLLRSRCGHNAPPTRIRFCSTGGDAVKLLSGGLDNALRVFALHKDVQMNVELSQGSLEKKAKSRGIAVEELKLPPVIDFATETTRAREWDGVVTCHAGLPFAHTWNLNNAVIGRHRLASRHRGVKAKPMCVAVSGCGHYVVLGMSTGHVELFNIQSGIHRGEFGSPRAHKGGVRGVAIDGLTMEVYSAGADSTVKFWSFMTKSHLDTIDLTSAAASINLHRDSCMLCIVSDDFSLLVVDTDTRRIVRTFAGHRNRITDVAFSPDGRRLFSSSMDCTIRTWDLPMGRLLDAFRVEAPPTSIALSPTGDFLCSTHVDDLAVYLWSNRTLYSHVSLRPLPSNHIPTVSSDLPHTTSPGDEDLDKLEAEKLCAADAEEDVGEVEKLEEDVPEACIPLEEGLVTLSDLPKSRWHNLQQLDVIKQRNKPKEPPAKPKQAPFFLPTVAGLQPKFITDDGDDDVELAKLKKDGASRILNLGALMPLTEFQKCLLQCGRHEEYAPLMALLKVMSPSSIDSEFRSLSPDAGGSLQAMETFMKCLLFQLRNSRDFELVEAYLGLFLKLHSSLLCKEPSFLPVMEQLLEQHSKTWTDLESELHMSNCLLSYFKSATV